GPDLVFLSAGDMAIGTLAHRFQFGSGCLWLLMIEIVEPPAIAFGITLGILDGNIGAIECSGEIAPPRRLRSRTIGILSLQRQLQLLEHDRPFRELTGLLEYLVGARLDVDVVILWEPCMAAIERVGSQRRSNIYPFVEILRQNQIAGGGVFGQITRLNLRL